MRLASDWHSTGDPLTYLGIPVVSSEAVARDQAIYAADPSGSESALWVALNPLNIFALVHDGDPHARLEAAIDYLMRNALSRLGVIEQDTMRAIDTLEQRALARLDAVARGL